MLESGIGRAANIHLSTLPNFVLSGDSPADGERPDVRELRLVVHLARDDEHRRLELVEGAAEGFPILHTGIVAQIRRRYFPLAAQHAQKSPARDGSDALASSAHPHSPYGMNAGDHARRNEHRPRTCELAVP